MDDDVPWLWSKPKSIKRTLTKKEIKKIYDSLSPAERGRVDDGQAFICSYCGHVDIGHCARCSALLSKEKRDDFHKFMMLCEGFMW